MATSEAGITSEQEMTDTAEEGETPMETSDPNSPIRHCSDDSNSVPNETEENDSMSTDRETSSSTPVQSSAAVTPTTPSTAVSTPGKKDNLPHRPGITWRKGERVEAMDYLNKWYPAKIMDIDVEEKAVLIHFEGWNSRYDEWTLMTSDGIRPLTRHSERKEKVKKQIKEFHVGEKVLAKWTDCKMYPAKVTSVHSNGCLEVIFYDGFQKTVQQIHVKPLQEKHKGKPFPSPKETKKITKPEGRRFSSEKVKTSRQEEKEEQGNLAERRRKHKLIVAGSFLAKRERSLSAPSLSEKQKRPRSGLKRGFGVRTSPVKSRRDSKLRTSPGHPKKTLTPKPSPVQPKKDSTEVVVKDTVKRAKKRALSLPAGEKVVGQKSSPNQPTTPSSAPAVPAKRSKSTEKDKFGGLAPKEFVIETDHNPFKCMITGCTKSFRKESLLDYHIKYYHMDGPRTPQPPASRTKRRKTSSICSTDSDISVSSKGKTTPGDGSASKRKRNISTTSDVLKEEPITEIKKELIVDGEEERLATSLLTPLTPLTPDLKGTPGADGCITEEKLQDENDDELAGDEVVNCVCGFNEENGLMIQCDVCLCWQHATCFSIKFEELPSKYICFVCKNPPGVRDSRRYIHDQGWFKSGQLPTFNFLDMKQSEEDMDRVRATNNLISDVLNFRAVLHSIKQGIKIQSNDKHREMKTWRRILEERRRKSRASATATVKQESVSEAMAGTSSADQDAPRSISKTEPDNDEAAEAKPAVTFSLNVNNQEAKPALKEEESLVSKSMACQASLDLSGSSLDRSDDKSFEVSAADIDSDTSTMTASESSTGYISCLPSAQTSSGVAADDNQTTGNMGEDLKTEKGREEKQKIEEPEIHEGEVEEEITFDDCQRSLLLHIVKVQSEMNDRLNFLEEQIAALEKAEANAQDPVVASHPAQSSSSSAAAAKVKPVSKDVPTLKRSLHSLIRDLGKVKTMAAYH